MSDIEMRNALQSLFPNAPAIEQQLYWTVESWGMPSVRFRPRIFIDGNQWCALYGENLQDGVAGFGDSPQEAMADFDKSWSQKLRPFNGDPDHGWRSQTDG